MNIITNDNNACIYIYIERERDVERDAYTP